MPVSGGPYLVAACFCDKVLQEADGVLSLIRVVDRWNVVGTTPAMSPSFVQGTLVILFKSGTVRGSGQITITPSTPNGAQMTPIIAPVLFEGDDERGTGVALPLSFPVKEPGLYWFEIALTIQGGQSQTITFVPMRIVYQGGVGVGVMGSPFPTNLGQ
jgi:hypothetical protein